MANGRPPKRSVSLHFFTELYFILALYFTLSKDNIFNTNPFKFSSNMGEVNTGFEHVFVESPQYYRRHQYTRRGFFSSRIYYYRNSSATVQQAYLLTSGDVSLNPGPERVVFFEYFEELYSDSVFKSLKTCSYSRTIVGMCLKQQFIQRIRRRKFLKSPFQYYPNDDASFNIEKNPGPTVHNQDLTNIGYESTLNYQRISSCVCSLQSYHIPCHTTNRMDLHNLSYHCPAFLHNDNAHLNVSQNLAIPVRITHRQLNNLPIYSTRNPSNLINVNITKKSSGFMPRLRLGTWNAHSLNKKAASICDLIISKRIDILSITETWLSAVTAVSDTTIAEILNTLQDYEFVHLPRSTGKGGGVGVLLRKGFMVRQNEATSYTSMEYIDLSITWSNTLIRLITVYRPPPSKKNKLTTSLFFSRIFHHA